LVWCLKLKVKTVTPINNQTSLTASNGNGHSTPSLPVSRQDLKKKALQQAKNDPERKLIETYFQELESQTRESEEFDHLAAQEAARETA
jgi:hypothetical protein